VLEEEDFALAFESVPEFLPFIRQNPRNNLKLSLDLAYKAGMPDALCIMQLRIKN